MIYQKIFMTEAPYSIRVGSLGEFPEHRHADFEMHYCTEGELFITMDKRLYRVPEGSLAFVPSMCSHAVPAQDGKRRVVTLIVGMSLLKKGFTELAKNAVFPQVYDLSSADGERVREQFCEYASLARNGTVADELLVMGITYKILGYLLRILGGKSERIDQKGDYSKVENVEKALELIYYHYKEPVTVERAAALTGYSKSNFCIMFKKVVGESFHHALNRQRVGCAAGLLQATDLSVSAVAAEVGFTESKTFCRVFKEIYGMTPGEYRSGNRNAQG